CWGRAVWETRVGCLRGRPASRRAPPQERWERASCVARRVLVVVADEAVLMNMAYIRRVGPSSSKPRAAGSVDSAASVDNPRARSRGTEPSGRAGCPPTLGQPALRRRDRGSLMEARVPHTDHRPDDDLLLFNGSQRSERLSAP